jgi:hypothetical protein
LPLREPPVACCLDIFIERGSPQGLDLSCIKAAPPLPFVTSLEKAAKRGP